MLVAASRAAQAAPEADTHAHNEDLGHREWWRVWCLDIDAVINDNMSTLFRHTNILLAAYPITFNSSSQTLITPALRRCDQHAQGEPADGDPLQPHHHAPAHNRRFTQCKLRRKGCHMHPPHWSACRWPTLITWLRPLGLAWMSTGLVTLSCRASCFARRAFSWEPTVASAMMPMCLAGEVPQSSSLPLARMVGEPASEPCA